MRLSKIGDDIRNSYNQAVTIKKIKQQFLFEQLEKGYEFVDIFQD